MILELGTSTEWIRVTTEYSNAVLVAVLPYISDFAKKLELPLPQPITAGHVVGCGIAPYRTRGCGGHDGPIGVRVKGDWSFTFSCGYVSKYEAPDSYYRLQDPDKVPRFFGQVRMNPKEAVALARNTITSLGIRLEDVFADMEPQVTSPERVGTNTVPHYRVEWLDPRGGSASARVDVNGEAGRVEGVLLRSRNLERQTPRLAVAPGILPARSPPVNPDYAWKLIPWVLRAVDNYGAKLGLPVPRSLTTNHVARFELHDNGGWPHCELELTNGWRFIYRNSMVNGYYAPDNLFNSDRRPILIKQFLGKWNMTEQEAIELIRRTIAKLNYPTNLVLMGFKPHVTKPTLPGIPRYSIYWWAENAAHDDLQCKVEAEVDADKRELKSLYYDHVAYWNHPPPVDVPISLRPARATNQPPAERSGSLPPRKAPQRPPAVFNAPKTK